MKTTRQSGPITIKKYGNRRLYDTDTSRYVTLEEVADRIRAGDEIRVVDARSAEDLTQATLAQIVLESRGAGRLLPTPLLIEMIRMGDGALAEFLGQWMLWALEMHGAMRRVGLGAVPNLLDPSALWAGRGGWAERMPGGLPWGPLFGGFGRRGAERGGGDGGGGGGGESPPARGSGAAQAREGGPDDGDGHGDDAVDAVDASDVGDALAQMRAELAALRARLDARERGDER